MFKKEKKKKRGLLELRSQYGDTIQVVIEALEEAGTKTRIRQESLIGYFMYDWARRDFIKSIPEWIDTNQITWIDEESKLLLSADRPITKVGAAAYDLFKMKIEGKNPELLDIIESLVLLKEDRRNWSVETMERSLEGLLNDN